ncbi:MAG: hypothetical protein GX471_08130, partial [Candidatus Microthrix parvicella]|nr:hypothetical protein [Candidatus Microthrix parvicella]
MNAITSSMVASVSGSGSVDGGAVVAGAAPVVFGAGVLEGDAGGSSPITSPNPPGSAVVDGDAAEGVVGDAGGALTCERLNRAFRLLMEGAGL